MRIFEFKKNNKIETTIELKDGRKLHTTENGFVYWVESKKGNIDLITEDQYKHALRHRINKKNK